ARRAPRVPYQRPVRVRTGGLRRGSRPTHHARRRHRAAHVRGAGGVAACRRPAPRPMKPAPRPMKPANEASQARPTRKRGPMRNRVVLTLTAATLLLASCTGHKAKPATSEGPYLRGSGTLRVLAGSELTDLQPILDQAQAATGVTVQLTVTGTLDGVQTVTD